MKKEIKDWNNITQEEMKNFFSGDPVEEFKQGEKEHGTITLKEHFSRNKAIDMVMAKEKEVAITQEPYVDGKRDEKPVFKASGVDADGNKYEITWDVVDNWEEVAEHGDNQQMVEDWDSPVSVEEI